MTNVSAVEKMAELMQQMEENSPRVAALEYCWPPGTGRGEGMIGMHYGTASVPRSEVLPGTMLQHHGKTYRASANVEKGLYAFNIFEKTIIKSDSVVVLLNERGEPMVH